MRKEREKADRQQRNLITVGIVVVVLALIAVGGYAVKSTSDKTRQRDRVITPKGATADHGVTFTPEDAGGKASPDTVQVVLYEDFQCPAARRSSRPTVSSSRTAVKKGEITDRVPHRHVPRSRQPQQVLQPLRLGRAVRLRCRRRRRVQEGRQPVWANQPAESAAGPEDPALVDALKQAGVSGARSESCVVQERFVPWLKEATERLAQGQGHRHADGPHRRQDRHRPEQRRPADSDLQKAIDAAKKS